MSVFPNISVKEKDEDIWGEDIDDDEWDLYWFEWDSLTGCYFYAKN